MNTNPAVEISPVRLDDVDLFSEWEIGLGWDIESTQLSAGPNEITFDHFGLPGVLVGHFCSKQSMKNVFAVPEGMVVLVFCRARLPIVWCGRHVAPTMLAVVRSGRENWVVIPPGLDAYELMISEELIRRAEIFPPGFFEATTELDRAFVPLIEPITGQFVRGLDFFFDLGRNANGFDETAVHGARFLDFIIDGLQQVVDAGLGARGSQGPRPARRLDLVPRARDFVSDHLTEDFSADDLAQALGVSYRALNYAFKDSLGMSPYRYVLTQKLHSVRRQLKSSGVSVTEASVLHGFYTPSRFARQYSRLFGELPSKTRYPDRRLTSP